MQSHIDATQIWLLSPQLSVALLGMLVLGVDLIGRRRRLTWLVALVGLVVPAVLIASLAFQWFGPLTLPATAFFGTLIVDQFTFFFLILFLVVALRRDSGLIRVRREVSACDAGRVLQHHPLLAGWHDDDRRERRVDHALHLVRADEHPALYAGGADAQRHALAGGGDSSTSCSAQCPRLSCSTAWR